MGIKRVREVIQKSIHRRPILLMAMSFFLRLICLGAIIYFHSQAASLPIGEEQQATYWFNKRAPLKKLHPFNPLFIFQQSIRKPMYADTKSASHNIPRRWVRRGSETHRYFPMRVWNHQLLPKFYTERQRFYNYYNTPKGENVAKRFNKQVPSFLSKRSFSYRDFNIDSDDEYSSEPEVFDFLSPGSMVE